MGTTDPLPSRVRELAAENEQLKTEIAALTDQISGLTGKTAPTTQEEPVA